MRSETPYEPDPRLHVQPRPVRPKRDWTLIILLLAIIIFFFISCVGSFAPVVGGAINGGSKETIPKNHVFKTHH